MSATASPPNLLIVEKLQADKLLDLLLDDALSNPAFRAKIKADPELKAAADAVRARHGRGLVT